MSQRSELELFALVLEYSPNLVFVKNENSVILMANPAFLNIYPPEMRDRIIGTTTVEEFSVEEAATFLAEDRRALDLGATEIVEEIIDYTGRKRVFLSKKIGFTTIEGHRRLLGMSSDITELAERERSLIDINKTLQIFSASAAHDLRSPLATFVSGLTLIRQDRNSQLSQAAGSYIDMMIESARGLAGNISSLLAASKGSRDKNAVNFAQCDLNLLFGEVKFNLTDLMQRTGAMIYADRLPHVCVEQNLIKQLLQNLFENSIKYRSRGRVPKIFLRHTETENGVSFCVEDNGNGVAASMAASAFELYTQASEVKIDGAGLGLPLCRQIVELHGGSIAIDQSYADGCRVVFDLPRAQNHAQFNAAA